MRFDVVSQKNARAIKLLADELPCRGRIDQVRLDPAASARSSLGQAAFSEYEREFGSRIIGRWPSTWFWTGWTRSKTCWKRAT